jgi:flagellar hook assembly protein FlgD
LIGYSTTLSSVDSTKFPDLVSSAPTAHCLIADIIDNADGRSDNRYMWDVRNSGLAAGTYYIYALCTDGTNAVIYQAYSANTDDQTITLTHGAFFQGLTPVDDQVMHLTKDDQFELKWNAYDMDVTHTNFIVGAFILPNGTSVVSTSTSASDVDGDANNGVAFWLTSTDGDNIASGNYANDRKYIVDVGDIVQDMGGAADVPSGLYDVYYVYDTDGDWTDDDETIVQADGQLYFEATGNASYEPNFLLTPNKVVAQKGDTVSVAVYIKDDGPDPEFVSVYLDVDNNNYLTVLDQDASTSGVQPFSGESTNYNGSVLLNNYTATTSGYELDYVEWANGGDALATSLKVATVQFKVSTTGPVDQLIENTITFSKSGSRISKLQSADGTDQDVAFAEPGAVISVAAAGKIAGFVDLEGRSESGEAITIYVCPMGSFDCITDADFLSANSDADASNGIQVTLGNGGTYSLTQIPAGKYDVVFHKDGYKDQKFASQTVYSLSTTTIDVHAANEMLAGDCAGYDHDGSSATFTQPDNEIDSDDTDAISTAFNATSSSSNWNAYCDIDGSGLIDVTDLNYSATNTGNGEGMIYRRIQYAGSNDDAIVRMVKVDEAADFVTYNVMIENASSIHATDVRLSINDAEWTIVSVEDEVARKMNTVSVQKSINNTRAYVSAIIGHEAIVANDFNLLTVKLRKNVENPSAPVVADVVIIDGNNEVAKPIIENGLVPTEFVLGQNYPNPFNPVTNIAFAIPEAGNVKIAIYNVTGQLVNELMNQPMSAGVYSATWNSHDNMGRKVSSGVYFYRLEMDGNVIATRKMLLVK